MNYVDRFLNFLVWNHLKKSYVTSQYINQIRAVLFWLRAPPAHITAADPEIV